MNNLLLGGETGYSVEMRFRIKNVKKYSTLVTTIPKYFYVDNDGTVSITSETEDWIKEHGYKIAKDEDGNLEMDEAGTEYILETENGVVLKWLNENN